MELFLVVGLGNPGDRYAHTRHNAGFDVVDILSQLTRIKVSKLRGHALVGEGKYNGHKLILAKPQTFMNLSGESVGPLVSWYKPERQRIVLVYDDIDLRPGTIRVRPGGSSGTHNGMRSVIASLGYNDFPRVRVGIGAPPEGYELVDWVVSHYNTEEARAVAFDSYMRAARAVLTLIDDGVEAGMRANNQKTQEAP